MIAPAPLASLPRADLVERRQVGAWPAEVGPNPRAGWAGPGLQTGDDAAIPLSLPNGGVQHLTRVVQVEAPGIDLLTVRTSAPVKGVMSLYWTAAQERFTQRRSLLAQGSERTEEGDFETRFEMRGAPGWTETIGRLRLVFRALRGEPVEVSFLGLEAHRVELRTPVDVSLETGAWRVELDDEVRDGFPCLEGRTRQWSVPEALHGTPVLLRFGFGTELLAGGAVAFEVRAEGEPAALALWDAQVGAEGVSSGVWHDAHLELASAPAALSFSCRHIAKAEVTRALAQWATPVLSPSSDARAGNKHLPNVVLISIDTLRPDRLSLSGYERQTSPHLDRWAEEAVIFERAVTSAPWTLPSHLSMLSGLDATRHGINHPVKVPGTIPLVAELLRDAGYQTAAWVGGGFMSPRFGLDRGFDRYRSWPDRAGEAELENGLERALRWLDTGPPEPFFLFFHTYETHYPFRPREPHYSRWAPDTTAPRIRDLAYISEHRESHQLEKLWRYRDGSQSRPLTDIETLRLSALYDSGVAYADEQIARLLTRLATAPWGDNTAIVVTSDHGEALGEKGRAGHAYLEDFNSLVPLILRLPAGGASGRVPSQVRIADVAPTLLELAGVSTPPEADGQSLLPLTTEASPQDRPASTYAAFSNRGLAVRPDRRWKLVFIDAALAPLAGQTTLFDLESDPDETSPATDVARATSLTRQAQREIASMGGVARVHLENRSSNALEGRLAGPAIGPVQLKAADASAAQVRLDAQGGARWRLDAGERLTLLIQNPRQARLSIDVDGSTIAALEPQDLVDGWKVQRVDGEWVAETSAGSSDARIEIDWPKGLAGIDTDPTASDNALLRQLEALGYVQ